MIDPLRFQQLRTTGRLSQRSVAAQAGVTVPVVRAVEEGRSGQLTLRMAGALARAVGTKVSDIVADGRDELGEVEAVSEGSDAERVIDDAQRLEALLFSAGSLYHQRAVAELLGISPERLRAAASHLEAQNETRGIHFYRLNVQMGLRASGRVESKKDLQRLARQMSASDGLNNAEAKVLFEFHSGYTMNLRRGDHRRIAHPTHERLLAAGLLERDELGRLALSSVVRVALEPGIVGASAVDRVRRPRKPPVSSKGRTE